MLNAKHQYKNVNNKCSLFTLVKYSEIQLYAQLILLLLIDTIGVAIVQHS